MNRSTEPFPEEWIVIHADPELEDLIPWYLEKREEDIEKIRSALGDGDYERVRALSHNMKGSGSGYGFEAITHIGAAIEKMAPLGDGEGIGRKIEELSNYLKRVRVIYE